MEKYWLASHDYPFEMGLQKRHSTGAQSRSNDIVNLATKVSPALQPDRVENDIDTVKLWRVAYVLNPDFPRTSICCTQGGHTNTEKESTTALGQ